MNRIVKKSKIQDMPQEKPKKKTAVRDSKPLSETPKFAPTGTGDSVSIRGSAFSSASMRPDRDWNNPTSGEYRKKYSQAAKTANKSMGERFRAEALANHYKATKTTPVKQSSQENYRGKNKSSESGDM